jgi:hypothetical protein
MFVLDVCSGEMEGSAAVSAEDSFPMTVENGGREVTIEKQPKRVFVRGTSAVTLVCHWASSPPSSAPRY